VKKGMQAFECCQVHYEMINRIAGHEKVSNAAMTQEVSCFYTTLTAHFVCTIAEKCQRLLRLMAPVEKLPVAAWGSASHVILCSRAIFKDVYGLYPTLLVYTYTED
jgi:hypothetical protein